MAQYGRSLLEFASREQECELQRIDVSLPGIDLRIRIPDSPLADAARTAFAAGDGLPGASRLEVEVSVLHTGALQAPAPSSWGREPYKPHEISKLLGEAGLQGSLFHDLRFWQFYDLEAHRGVQLMKGPEAFPPWEPGAPLRAFLHWAYAAQGRRMTHAGCLGLDGRGVLLAGAGGAGKSGTVLAGILNGLSSVGDDYVLVDMSQDAVSAHPVYSTLKQDAKGMERLGLDRLLGPRNLNWQGKVQFRASEIGALVPADGLEVAAVLLPRTGSPRTTIRPATRAEALLALAPSAVYQMPGERESGFRFFSRLVARLPVFHLDLGPDPKEVAGTIGAFIAGGSA